MDKLEKWVYCAYQEKRYQSWPTYWKRTFRCPRGRRILHSSTRVCSPWWTKVKNCAAMLSKIREKLNPPTDNEQLLRLKRMSKSPNSNPLLRDLAMHISVRKLNILLIMLMSWAQRDKTLEEKVTFIDTKLFKSRRRFGEIKPQATQAHCLCHVRVK